MFQDQITFALTSCGRYDLLERTIQSIEQTIDLSKYKKIITEDSRDEKHINQMKEANESGFLKWYTILYTSWSGQDDVLKCHYYALKKLYENIDTKYVFHCEDDQVFYKTNFDFMQLSYDILENNEKIAIVILRDLHKDYWIKKEWIMRSRYYDILTDAEQNFYWHDFIHWNPNAILSLQPGLRNVELMRKAMFWYEETVNEALASKRLSNLWYSGIYIKEGIYYNPNWRFNSTRSMKSIWYIKYIKTTLRNAISYRFWLVEKHIKYLLSNK